MLTKEIYSQCVIRHVRIHRERIVHTNLLKRLNLVGQTILIRIDHYSTLYCVTTLLLDFSEQLQVSTQSQSLPCSFAYVLTLNIPPVFSLSLSLSLLLPNHYNFHTCSHTEHPAQTIKRLTTPNFNSSLLLHRLQDVELLLFFTVTVS